MMVIQRTHLGIGKRNCKSRGCQSVYTNLFKNSLYSFFMHFCPGTMTTHAESINSDLQRGLDRRLQHTQH